MALASLQRQKSPVFLCQERCKSAQIQGEQLLVSSSRKRQTFHPSRRHFSFPSFGQFRKRHVTLCQFKDHGSSEPRIANQPGLESPGLKSSRLESSGVESSALERSPRLESSLKEITQALEGDSQAAAEVASGLIGGLSEGGRNAVLSALFQTASENVDDVFKTVDVNADGTLSKEEFAEYVEAQALEMRKSTRPPTQEQLFLLSLRAAIGNIGFGFTDNVIMIVAGDYIQGSIGTTLGLSTLMSAGLGNCVADVIGAAFKESIEGASSKFMPDPKASPFQLATKEAWWAETVGASTGIATGCVLGLAPLFILGRWRAVDDVETLEKTAPGLIESTLGDPTPGVASTVALASWGPSDGSPSQSRGLRDRRTMSRTAVIFDRPSVSRLSSTVAVPQRHLQITQAADKSISFWVFLALAIGMCIKRVVQFRSQRGLTGQVLNRGNTEFGHL